ncbi:MATH domain-containing protein [Caenorhabditis elegans]|uniref:MATH domain-containing protein n=1 Tax=Caenorhabditis elegans TaxID=6239 RepID=Q9TZA4_CAEEL|nr:MATH domain-containing protein [Caenorhabditis elegans]CCD66471.1 MATH domain-containing protein [Caenorhabditis elegans]|eukprot:NP_494201.2 MATH (meprin-associated Traf homology) domain containing [Caenorhabditis elegans]
MSSYAKSFVLLHTFKNISSLKENENRYSNVERRYNTPWKLGISRKNGMLAVYLYCNKEFYMHRKWSIQTKYTMKLVAVSGKYVQRTMNTNYEFQNPTGNGFPELISWENMQRDYVNDDSILIEAHANIINMTDTPTWQPNIGKSFVLKHTFGNISRFVRGEQVYSDIEEHYNIPWRITISKCHERLGIYLYCKKAVCEGKKYEVKCEFEVQLISSSGKCDAGRRSVVFDQPYGRGMTLISWEKMKKYYVDNDSINVEVIVNIIDIKGWCHVFY